MQGQFVRVLMSIDDAELPVEAAALRDTLAGLRLRPVTDERDADLFVGVYADRYGVIDPARGVSRLEQQYLAAGSRPRLVYVLPGTGERDQHLALLLSRIQADDLTSYRRVSGAEELVRLVADDITMVLTEAFTGEAYAAAAPQPAPAAEPRPSGRPRIPAPWHRLIGRDRDATNVCRLITGGHTRLLTLTGPGGIGKSRLAIEVAARCADDFRDGVWFVDLAAARDPALVAPTIAHALGVREAAGALPVTSLKSYLASMRALVLLDSFEPVLAAAPLVVDLLLSAPDLRILVTSRSVLRVRGEQEYPLPPLVVPEEDVADPAASPALELFLERAAAANPTRDLSPPERAAAAEICRRLDGVPLALELAAARTRVLSPTALLGKLSQALDVLGSGPRDLPERQRALRTTLDWDHALLGADERIVFRRLAVFSRTFTLGAAERVAGDGGPDVMEGLDSLVGKSLVRSADPAPVTGDPCFVMLQTVQEYAHERLVEAGEHEDVHRRHASYVLEHVQACAAAAPGEQEDWLAVLEHEHADLRVALEWADRAAEVELLLELAAGLGIFWVLHCHFSEGRRWLERSVTLSAGQRTAVRAELLNSAAYLSRARGDWDVAQAQYEEGLAIREELGDLVRTASSERFLGNVAFDRGDVDGAERWWRRSLATVERTGDELRRSQVINNLGVLAHHRGDEQEAIALYEEVLAHGLRSGSRDQQARAQMNIAISCNAIGDHERARELARSSIATYAELDDTWDLVDALDALACAEGRSGSVVLAAWLYGGAAALRTALAVRRPVAEQDDYERDTSTVRASDPDAYDRAFADGQGASLTQIVDRALERVAT